MAPICQACQRIFNSPPDPNRRTTRHHQTFHELQRSADRRCFICSVVWDDILNRYGSGVLESSTSPSNRSDKGQAGHSASDYDLFTDSPGVLRLDIYYDTDFGDGLHAFKLKALKESEYNRSYDNNFVSQRSPFNLNVAREWLDTCLDHHSGCQVTLSRTTGRLPTRVLEIDRPNFDEIRLVNTVAITPEVTPKYATLSHCWGRSRVARFTSELEQSLRAGIPITELSHTASDAVKITRSLGLPYLWIDSLCIAQDSEEDWLREAPRMMEVYGSAVINIAATSGADNDAGCLPEQNENLSEPVIVVLEGTGLPDGRYVLYDCKYREDAFGGMPLLKRGWVAQELLLAPRVLHFCKTEMFWECPELIASEMYQPGLPPGMVAPSIPRELAWKALKSLPGHAAALTDDNSVTLHEVLWRVWPEVIAYYSFCGLTYMSDKLAAISGIAKLVRHSFGVEYCTGLWNQDLEYQLLWTGRTSGPRYPPSTYRAPTWSWASMDGGVKLRGYGRGSGGQKLVAAICDCHIETQTGDNTVGIIEGFLRLSGSLVTMKFCPDPETRDYWHAYINGKWQKGLYPAFDSEVPTEQVHGIPILVDKDESQPPNVRFLLLQPTGEVKGRFYRVGEMNVPSRALGISGRNYDGLKTIQNESWLEFESCDDEGTYSVVVV